MHLYHDLAGWLNSRLVPNVLRSPFRLADYLLLRIDGSANRDDYRHLASIAGPYNDFLAALDKLDLEAAVAAERNLKTAIFRCADLARFDRPRAWDAFAKEIEDLKSSYGMGAKGVLSHTLDEVMAAWAVPMSEVESLAAFSALQP